MFCISKSILCLLFFDVVSCFLNTSREIGEEECLQNDLLFVSSGRLNCNSINQSVNCDR